MTRFIPCLIVVAACSTSSPSAPSSPKGAPEIFRQVQFDPFAAIALGKPVPPDAPPLMRVAENTLRLTNGRFGDTDSIYVRLANGSVRGMEFFYGSQKDVAAAVASYRDDLGVPHREETTDSAGGSLYRATWRNASTLFQISRYERAGRSPRAWSTLVDRR